MPKHALPTGRKLYALALVTGLAITGLLVLLAWTQVSEDRKRAFETDAGRVWQNAAHKIESNHEALGHFGALFVASMDVETPDQFRLYSMQLLESHPAAKAAVYMPYLLDKDRMGFEGEQRQKGYSSYAVTQWKDGQYSPSPEAAAYFPVLHIEPFAVPNVRMLGFNPMSEPSLKTAIDLAIESAEPVPAESPIATDEIWVFKALYAGTETPPAVWRRGRANGLIAIRLARDKLIDAALLKNDLQADVSIQPQQPDDAEKARRRQHHMSTPTRQTHDRLSREFRADFPTYSVRMTVSQPWKWRDFDFRPLGVALLAGMAVTVAFLAMARTATIRTREATLRSEEIERQVELKTLALRESEQRTQMIIVHALDAVATMNQSGEIVGWNPRAEAIFGWKAHETLGQNLGNKIVPERHRVAHSEGLKRFLATGKAALLGRLIEITGLHRDGYECPIELAISAIATNEGTCSTHLSETSANARGRSSSCSPSPTTTV